MVGMTPGGRRQQVRRRIMTYVELLGRGEALATALPLADELVARPSGDGRGRVRLGRGGLGWLLWCCGRCGQRGIGVAHAWRTREGWEAMMRILGLAT